MSRLTDFFEQLAKRRVIRAGVLYAAGVWLILQVADLLAQAGMVSDDFVRWMILLGLIFSPISLALTWFFEHPWHGRPLGEDDFICDGYPINQDTSSEG